MGSDFFDRQTVTAPTDICLVCGAIRDANTSGDTCVRCGATPADVHLLLRAGADAYARARNAALALRFDEAREQVAIGTLLGFGFVPAFIELTATLDTLDAPVTSKQGHDYAVAHHLSRTGKFAGGQRIALAKTPIAHELSRLSDLAARRVAYDRALHWVCTALIGTFFVWLVSLFR